jgi:phosphoserine aminotransferase
VSFANTGHWSEKAITEASFISEVHTPVKVLKNEQGLSYIPDLDQWDYDPDSAFLHYCDNETVEGLEF